MNTRVLVGVVAVGATVILLTPPVRRRIAGYLPSADLSPESLAPRVQSGAHNMLNVLSDYRPQLVDAVTFLLTNREGTANTTDPAARARAERLVSQGISILETLVDEPSDDQRTIEGQVVPPPAPS